MGMGMGMGMNDLLVRLLGSFFDASDHHLRESASAAAQVISLSGEEDVVLGFSQSTVESHRSDQPI